MNDAESPTHGRFISAIKSLPEIVYCKRYQVAKSSVNVAIQVRKLTTEPFKNPSSSALAETERLF